MRQRGPSATRFVTDDNIWFMDRVTKTQRFPSTPALESIRNSLYVINGHRIMWSWSLLLWICILAVVLWERINIKAQTSLWHDVIDRARHRNSLSHTFDIILFPFYCPLNSAINTHKMKSSFAINTYKSVESCIIHNGVPWSYHPSPRIIAFLVVQLFQLSWGSRTSKYLQDISRVGDWSYQEVEVELGLEIGIVVCTKFWAWMRMRAVGISRPRIAGWLFSTIPMFARLRKEGNAFQCLSNCSKPTKFWEILLFARVTIRHLKNLWFHVRVRRGKMREGNGKLNSDNFSGDPLQVIVKVGATE